MRVVIFLLALAGLSSASWIPGKEYYYSYAGRVATGLSEIDTQYSGAGMKAQVHIQVKDTKTLIASFENVFVGSMNDHIDPEKISYELPIEYGESSDKFKEQMSYPVVIHLDEEDNFMFHDAEVYQEELLAVTNMKKAVLNLFRVDTFHMDEHHVSENKPEYLSHDHPELAYYRKEQTIYGTCDVRYVVIPMDDIGAATFERFIPTGTHFGGKSEKITSKGKKTTSKTHKGSKTQKGGAKGGSKTSKYTEEAERLWYVRKNIDFDKCEDTVILRSEHPYTFKGPMAHSTNFKKTLTRSSMSTYLMRGNTPSCLRLELVVSEGVTTMNPFGFRTESISAFTNQTLILLNVEEIDDYTYVPEDLKPVTTWKMDDQALITTPEDMEAGYDVFDHASLEHELPYHFDQDNLLEQAKTKINIIFEEMKHKQIDVSKAYTLGNFIYLTKTVGKMNKDTIYKLCHAITSSQDTIKRSITIDAVLASGSTVGVNFLMDRIGTNHFEEYFVERIFIKLPLTLRFPTTKTLNTILSTVENIDFNTHTRMKIKAILNFARLVHNACVDPKRRTIMYPTEIQHHSFCTEEYVDDVLPFYQEGLEMADAPWKQMVWIQAVSQLGSPKVFPIVEKYITGKATTETLVRMNALWSVYADYAPPQYHQEIINLLLPIIENWSEPGELRMAAIACMSLLNTGRGWWQRLAMSTWKEPNPQVVDFIYTLMHDLARSEDQFTQSITEIARHLLPMLKPANNVWMKSSHVHMLSQFVQSKATAGTVWLSVSRSAEQIFPSETFYMATYSLGGASLELASIGMMSQGIDKILQPMLRNWMGKEDSITNIHDMAAKQAMKILKTIEDELEPELVKENPLIMSIVTTFFQDMQALYIISYDNEDGPSFVEGSYGKDTIDIMAHYLMSGFKFDYTNTVYAVNKKSVFPSDLGMPVVIEVINPNQVNFHIELSVDPRSPVEAVKMKIDIKNMQEIDTSMKVVVPYLEESVQAGVQNVQGVHVPLEITAGFHATNKEATFNFNFIDNEKVHIYAVENRPYTIRAPFNCLTPLVEKKDYKLVIHKQHIYEEHSHISNNVVFQLDHEVKSDYPITSGFFDTANVLNVGTSPLFLISPVSHFWKSDYYIDLAKSKCKGLNMKIGFSSMKKKEEFKEYEQFSQTTGGFDYGQQSQGADYESFQEVDDSYQQRSSKMQTQQENIIKDMKRGGAHSLSLHAICVGNEKKEWDIAFTWAHDFISLSKKFHLALQRTPEDINDDKFVTCIDGEIIYPRITKMNHVSSIMETAMKTPFKMTASFGKSCNAEPGIKIKGFMDVSKDWIAKKTAEHKVHECLEWETHEFDEQFANKETILEKQCQILKKDITQFDHIDYTITWNDIPDRVANRSLQLKHLMRAFLYKRMSVNSLHVNNGENSIHVEAHRDHYSDLWNAHLAEPHENVVYKNLKFVKLNAMRMPVLRHEKHNFCDITKHQIKTFDGVTYPFHNSNCWKVLAKDCSKFGRGAVLTAMKDGHPIVRIVSPQNGYIIEVHNHQLKINGEVMDTSEKGYKEGDGGKYFAKWSEEGIFVKVGHTVGVMLRDDNIVVKSTGIYFNKFCGLCGNMNGQWWADLAGPKKCVYNDPEQFVSSWTLLDFDCASPVDHATHTQVKTFQQNCPKMKYNSLNDIYHEVAKETYGCK